MGIPFENRGESSFDQQILYYLIEYKFSN